MTLLVTIAAMLAPALAAPEPTAPAEPARRRVCQPCAYSRHNRRRARRRLELARWYLRRHRATRPYRGWLASTRGCETRGQPAPYSTNTGNGFYGAYQFTLGTWWSVGGHGYPHLAPPLEQDFRAVRLLVTGGPGHWPVCG
jgi:Transglycosylase-like domain